MPSPILDVKLCFEKELPERYLDSALCEINGAILDGDRKVTLLYPARLSGPCIKGSLLELIILEHSVCFSLLFLP